MNLKASASILPDFDFTGHLGIDGEHRRTVRFDFYPAHTPVFAFIGCFVENGLVRKDGARVDDLALRNGIRSAYGQEVHRLADVDVVGEKLIHLSFPQRSEEHTSELQSLMRTSYAVFFLKK